MAIDAKTLVKCSVSNCHYWGEQNVCKADTIMIEIDRHADVKLNEEYGEETFMNNHRDVAEQSSATCCLTFKPKK
ncbi:MULTISPECIES: DUF1540 domain-containing protein [Paenibacillus]|uniref:DUF1540 domain-containing protein n=1 Tax=Paenibacillus campinasensis TaxID=66347 RepID=A0A268F4S0_9BACL|nr:MULTISPECIES: DUF1540 domain-containing protein [Paenibacillus]MUG64621.1 DUF1540 domain-containing protein [Paenibacillus campinasensis]PAD80344.1 DUF1540 domain-containing protein [Paenibacillus campinasensis]PAK55327.1 DUF1540 domain-containing protein [Paenibacillus sp. 7541]